MPLVLDGTNGVSGVDGTASNPAIEGTDSNTGIFYPAADTVAIGTGGTEALRVNSSQNVGIGTTNLNARFEVQKNSAATAPTSDNIFPSWTSGASLQNLSQTNGAYTGLSFLSANADGTSQGFSIAGQSTASGFSSNLLFIARTASGSGTERARITSDGNFLVGTTDSSTASGNGCKILPNGKFGAVGTTAALSDTYNYYNSTAGAYRFYVTSAGVINATSTTITAISDQRLKENIEDIDVGLDAVMALKPRKFDWKEGKGKDKKGDRGWIAQEFEQVFPDMISTWKDEPPEGEEPYKAVNADLIPILVKAIQELNAKVEAQAAEIAALKGNA